MVGAIGRLLTPATNSRRCFAKAGCSIRLFGVASPEELVFFLAHAAKAGAPTEKRTDNYYTFTTPRRFRSSDEHANEIANYRLFG